MIVSIGPYSKTVRLCAFYGRTRFVLKFKSEARPHRLAPDGPHVGHRYLVAHLGGLCIRGNGYVCDGRARGFLEGFWRSVWPASSSGNPGGSTRGSNGRLYVQEQNSKAYNRFL